MSLPRVVIVMDGSKPLRIVIESDGLPPAEVRGVQGYNISQGVNDVVHVELSIVCELLEVRQAYPEELGE